jgi:hypothetical protein
MRVPKFFDLRPIRSSAARKASSTTTREADDPNLEVTAAFVAADHAAVEVDADGLPGC